MGESYGIGADYAAGPFAVKYVYQNTAVTNGVMNAQNGSAVMATNSANLVSAANPAANGAQQEQYIGASFDLKVVKLMGSAQILDKGNRASAGLGAQGAVYQFGAVVPVGKGNIHASYAYADMNSGNRAGNAYHGEYQGVSVAYTHGLSKRTTLYTGVRYQDLDQKASNTANATLGGITTVFAAGINHSF
jgi:predicted porin